MEEQNRLRQEISEEMLELKEFRDEMREETRYEDGEISKSQAELNEEMYVFMAEFKEEFAQFRAQNDEQMADIRSKLHTIKDLLHDMMKGVGLEPPLDRVNSNPDDPIGDVAACNEKSEPNVQNVETLNSTTPITGISAASTYTTRFKETTDDIAVDGKKNATGSEVCSDVCSVVDELTESSSAVLLKGPVMEPFARYLFDETPKLFPADSDGGVYEKISLSKTEALEIGHHLIDEMPELTSADQNKRVDAHEELILPIVVFPRDLSYGSEVTMVSSFNFSSKSNIEEEFMFVDLKNHMFGADCWIDGILMFIFDPGGGFSPQMDSDVLKNDNELVKMGRETNGKNRGNFIETSVNKNNVWKVLENAFTYEENLIGANGYLEYELLVDAQLDCILVFHFVEIVINWKTSNVGFVNKVGKEWTGMALWYWFGNYLKIMVVGDHCVTPNNSAIMFLLEISISGIPMVGLVNWQPNEVEYLRKSLETIEGVCERICLSRYQMIVFDHGGCRKLAWLWKLWIERVISLLYDLSHVDYLVMCLGSHILKYIGRTSSVDEMKRGVHFAAAIAVMISSSDSKSGQHISATHQIQQAYNSVVETSSNVGAETTFSFTMVTVLYLTTGTNDYIHFYQHNVPTVQFSLGTWSFNQSLAQTMKQKFKDLYIEGFYASPTYDTSSPNSVPAVYYPVSMPEGGFVGPGNVAMRMPAPVLVPASISGVAGWAPYVPPPQSHGVFAAPGFNSACVTSQNHNFLTVFIWDPGPFVVFLHILEGKDVFKGMVTQLNLGCCSICNFFDFSCCNKFVGLLHVFYFPMGDIDLVPATPNDNTHIPTCLGGILSNDIVGGYLLIKGICTLPSAPRGLYEAKMQLALEDKMSEIVDMLSTCGHSLQLSSDPAYCFRCGVVILELGVAWVLVLFSMWNCQVNFDTILGDLDFWSLKSHITSNRGEFIDDIDKAIDGAVSKCLLTIVRNLKFQDGSGKTINIRVFDPGGGGEDMII